MTDFLTSAGASRLLGVTPATVRQMERRGELKALRANGIRLFRKADVERLAKRRQARRSYGS